MAQDKPEEHLSESRRQEIFLALVDAQDHDQGVSQSRRLIATRFGVSESQVRQIEREGLDRLWPPL
jgi:DNA-directed RNA polymerase sigma subunit (sigma70/sigma32)